MIGLAIVYFLKWLGGAGDTAAKVGGYSLGLATSFVLNRNGTFYHSGPWLPAFVRFLSVFVIAYASNLGTVLALIAQFGTNGYIAQACGVPPYTTLFLSRQQVPRIPRTEARALRPELAVLAPSASAAACQHYTAIIVQRKSLLDSRHCRPATTIHTF
jgi:hypothetical protein